MNGWTGAHLLGRRTRVPSNCARIAMTSDEADWGSSDQAIGRYRSPFLVIPKNGSCYFSLILGASDKGASVRRGKERKILVREVRGEKREQR